MKSLKPTKAMKKAGVFSVLALSLIVPSMAHAEDMMMKPVNEMDMQMPMTMPSMPMGPMATMGMGNETDMLMMNNRANVPLRLLAESLGYDVMWNASDRSITLSFMGMGKDMNMKMADPSTMSSMKEPYNIKVMMDSMEVMVGMEKKMLSSAPFNYEGKTYVSKDFVTMYLLAPYRMMNGM